MPIGTSTVWRTVRKGEYRTLERYANACAESGDIISNWAVPVLKEASFAQSPIERSLVYPCLSAIGVTEDTPYDDVCAFAISSGLRLPDAETALALRLSYRDQPEGEWVRIGMKPITGTGGYRDILAVVTHHGARCLLWAAGSSGISGSLPLRWGPGSRLVFELP